jgi:5-dehydro-2-deoxygluconokinase
VTDETTATVLRRLYDLGIRPDWWKLEPQATRTAWQRIGDEIRARDPFCRGVVLLGLEASEAVLEEAFQAAAGDPIVKGFAVGRTIFAEPADAWLRGQIDDEEAIAEMAKRFERLAEAWKKAKRANSAAA